MELERWPIRELEKADGRVKVGLICLEWVSVLPGLEGVLVLVELWLKTRQ